MLPPRSSAVPALPGTRPTLLLDAGTTSAAEPEPGDLPEPDDRTLEQLLHSRIESTTRGQTLTGDEIAGTAIWSADQAD